MVLEPPYLAEIADVDRGLSEIPSGMAVEAVCALVFIVLTVVNVLNLRG
jgi:hypothetical protein